MANKKKNDDEKYSADDLVIGDEDEDDYYEDEDEDEDDLEDEDEDDEGFDDEDLDEGEDEFEDDDEQAPATGFGGPEPANAKEDPLWWTPHLVLFSVLLVSVLGFFGVFNPWLGPLVAQPAGSEAAPSAQSAAAPTPAPRPAKTVKVGADQLKRPQAQGVLGAKHILVQYKGSMRANADKIKRSKDEAKKLAADVAKKAAKTKSDAKRDDAWKKLVEQYSDEPGAAARAGNLGKFKKGSYHPKFVAGVEKLKVGGVSGPVETPFGYHIIWRTQ